MSGHVENYRGERQKAGEELVNLDVRACIAFVSLFVEFAMNK